MRNGRLFFVPMFAFLQFQTGGLTPSDVQSTPRGRLISCFNAPIKAVSGDAGGQVGVLHASQPGLSPRPHP